VSNDKKLTDTVAPVDFSWNDDNMSTGFIAQEIGATGIGEDSIAITISDSTGGMTNSPIYTTDTITLGAVGAVDGQYNYTYSTGSIDMSSINFGSNKSVLRTSKNEIDLDELADLLKVLKKRLLIIAPDFEKHEKYPMLKELYEEYKAMERLLSGPESGNENE
jgi:hypothetical protein